MCINLYLYMSIIAVIHLNINIPAIHRKHCGNHPTTWYDEWSQHRGKHLQPGSDSFRWTSGVDIACAVFLMSVTCWLGQFYFVQLRHVKHPRWLPKIDRTQQTGTKIIYIIYRTSSPHLTLKRDGSMYESLYRQLQSLFTCMHTPSLSVGPILCSQYKRERKREIVEKELGSLASTTSDDAYWWVWWS